MTVCLNKHVNPNVRSIIPHHTLSCCLLLYRHKLIIDHIMNNELIHRRVVVPPSGLVGVLRVAPPRFRPRGAQRSLPQPGLLPPQQPVAVGATNADPLRGTPRGARPGLGPPAIRHDPGCRQTAPQRAAEAHSAALLVATTVVLVLVLVGCDAPSRSPSRGPRALRHAPAARPRAESV